MSDACCPAVEPQLSAQVNAKRSFREMPLTRMLMLGAAIAIACLIGVTSVALHQSRLSHEARAQAAGENLARLLAQNLATTIDKADIALQLTAYEMSRQEARPAIDGAAVEAFLAKQRALRPEMADLRIAGADGAIRFGARDAAQPLARIGDRDYFRRAQASTALVVAGPILSRITGQPVMVLARRLDRADGSFAGVAYATVTVARLQALFVAIQSGHTGGVALLNDNLQVIAGELREPAMASAQNGSWFALLREALRRQPQEGTLATRGERVDRLDSYAGLSRYPLHVVVGQTDDAYLEAWRHEAWQVGGLAGLVGLLILAAAWLTYRAWRRQWQAGQSLRESEERFRLMVAGVTDYAIIMIDAAGRIATWNGGAQHLNGYAAGEIIGRHVSCLFPAETGPGWIEHTLRRTARQGCSQIEGWRMRQDGSTYIAHEVVTAVRDEAGQLRGYSLITHDITERKHSEQEQRRLHRALQLLSDSNSALVHARDEQTLLHDICRLMVDNTYLMAWVGLTAAEGGQVLRPAAQAGYVERYPDGALRSWADTDYGRHGALQALQSGTPHISHVPDAGGGAGPVWRDPILAQHYQACIALPLIHGPRTLGTLSIYAAEADAFAASEVALLAELARNLAHGLQAIRLHATLEAERLFSQSLIDSTPGVFYVINTAGHFQRWNRNFEEVTGKSATEMRQISPLDLFAGPDREMIARRIADVFADGQAVAEANFLTRDGSTCPYLFTGTRVAIEGQTLLVGMGLDVSSLRHMEAELAQYRHHLEELVAQRTAELDTARQAAERASQAKSVFLANMSHELRTPLNAIIGFTEILRRTTLPSGPEDKVYKISTAARHLLAIINDVLDLSKIDAGKLKLEVVDFDMAELVERVADMIREGAERKGLELRLHVDPAVSGMWQGDVLRLQQILLNFASNAIKFTESGRIRLGVAPWVVGGASAGVRFDVTDTGIGISTDAIERLFQSFEQADSSTTRKYGGTGLGLAISRRLAQQMGGSVGVRSELGQGSTFWFTAVLARAHQPGPDTMRRPATGPDPEALLREQHGHARILLAEDEPINREVAAELLQDLGLDITMADDGAMAVDYARNRDFDLILMDMQMPRLDGLSAARLIRELPRHGRTPIIAMTANSYPEDRQRCLESGMNDHLGKPYLPDDLIAVLLKWLPPRTAPVEEST